MITINCNNVEIEIASWIYLRVGDRHTIVDEISELSPTAQKVLTRIADQIAGLGAKAAEVLKKEQFEMSAVIPPGGRQAV